MSQYTYPSVPRNGPSPLRPQQQVTPMDDGRFSWVQTPAEARGRTWQTEADVPPLPQVPHQLNTTASQREPTPSFAHAQSVAQDQDQQGRTQIRQQTKEQTTRERSQQPQQRKQQRSRASSRRRDSNAQYSLFPQQDSQRSQHHTEPEAAEASLIHQAQKQEPEQVLVPPALPTEQIDSPIDPYMHQPLYQPDTKPEPRSQSQPQCPEQQRPPTYHKHTEPQRSPTQRLHVNPISFEPDTNPLSPTTPTKSPVFPPTTTTPTTNLPIILPTNTTPTLTMFPATYAATQSQAPKGGPYSTTLTSCLPHPLICLTSLSCPCITYSRTQHRLDLKSEHRDPTNMLGHSAINGSCLVFMIPGISGLLAGIQRMRIRRIYEMEKASVVSDMGRGCCCLCCVVGQGEREIRIREEGVTHRKELEDGDVYKAVAPMTFEPPPKGEGGW